MKIKSDTALRICSPLINERGIALLLTLVVLVLLTAVIVEFDYGAKVNLITAGNFRDDIQATYLAKAGVTAARAVLKDDAKNQSGYDGLDEFWARPLPPYPVGEGFVSVEITDEGGKINVNRLGNSNTQVSGDTQEMLKRLLKVLEIESGQIDPIVNAIHHWVDPSTDIGHECEEDSYYQRQDPPYHCKKAPMDTLSELLLIEGVTPEIYKKIRPYLTTVSTTNQINVNTAAPEVLHAMDQNLSTDNVTCIQGQRPFKSKDGFYGCTSACKTDTFCQRQIGWQSDFFTVKAHGIMHDTDKIVTALIDRSHNKIMSWQIE
ncbi:MAG: type II secretion system minor pseudopilin GspK [Nitrospirae bacterium]|nr:type II secretion system minor pseudopilin GspK [Nitrospirota bacterium]